LWRRSPTMNVKSFSILDFVIFAIPLQPSFTALCFILHSDATVYRFSTYPAFVLGNHACKVAVKSKTCFPSFALGDWMNWSMSMSHGRWTWRSWNDILAVKSPTFLIVWDWKKSFTDFVWLIFESQSH
jgi:hypothetical protein